MICGHLPPDQALKVYLSKATILHGIDTTQTPTKHTTGGEIIQPKSPIIPLKAPIEATPVSTGPTVEHVVAKYLKARTDDADCNRISPRTLMSIKEFVHPFLTFCGSRQVADMTPTDFGEYRNKLAKKYKCHALDRHIIGIRSMFNWAEKNEITTTKPRYGTMFDKPTASQKQKERNKREEDHGERMFSVDQVRAILRAAKGQMKAMILLGLNCGFGNIDIAQLPMSAIKLPSQWLDFPRPKTGDKRRAYLWPETIKALRKVLANRPEPVDRCNSKLVFLTRNGEPWCFVTPERTRRDRITWNFWKLLTKVGIRNEEGGDDKLGLNFYSLRRTFRTIADEANDQHAAMRIMGHKIRGMSGTYVQRIEDRRIKKVSRYVRKTLFGANAATGTPNNPMVISSL